MKTWVWVPFQVDKKFDGYRIDRFLAGRLESYSRTQIQKILEEARVTKAGRPTRASAKVKTGEIVEVAYLRKPEEPLTEDQSLPILFEDDDLLIINKPANLLSHPTDKTVLHTVTGILKHQRKGLPPVHLLHRLDRETSGVLALAKNATAARRWTKAMESHLVQKEYLAIICGVITPCIGLINLPIGREGGEIKVRQSVKSAAGVPAETAYQVEKISPKGDLSLVRAFPHTGRLHQIRVHFAAKGHPLLGDKLYQGEGEVYAKMIRGESTEADIEGLGFPRAALHAAGLRFRHPSTQKEMHITAPLPADMAAFIEGWANSDKIPSNETHR